MNKKRNVKKQKIIKSNTMIIQNIIMLVMIKIPISY